MDASSVDRILYTMIFVFIFYLLLRLIIYLTRNDKNGLSENSEPNSPQNETHNNICPICGAPLTHVGPPSGGTYICSNKDCPSNAKTPPQNIPMEESAMQQQAFNFDTTKPEIKPRKVIPPNDRIAMNEEGLPYIKSRVYQDGYGKTFNAFVTPNGKCYHKSKCPMIKGRQHKVIHIYNAIMDENLQPCPVCNPRTYIDDWFLRQTDLQPPEKIPAQPAGPQPPASDDRVKYLKFITVLIAVIAVAVIVYVAYNIGLSR